MSDVIPDAVVLAALDLVLRKPLGTSLKNYMPQSQADAIAAMRGVLMAERERCAGVDWQPAETAPVEQTVIAWGNGGQRFMRRDAIGQWRNMLGHPRPAPKFWTPMLANPITVIQAEAA
jgi:hypothetical protein